MKKIFIALLFSLVFYVSVGAKESCTIVTQSWLERTNEDGSGYYFDIIRAVFEPNGYKVDYKIVPWKRSVAMIEAREADMMLGVFYNPESVDATRFVKWPFDLEETVVVYKKASVKKWEGEKTLENQKVLWNRGYNYHKFLKVKVDWSETDDVATGLSMLDIDRIKFFMVDKNGLTTLKSKPLDKNIYELQTVIVNGLLPAFAKNEKGNKLASIYEEMIPKLIKNGELKRIFEKYGKKMPNLTPRK